MSTVWIIQATDFLAAFLFIYGLKRMSSPVTARSGVRVAGYGMLLAMLAGFLYVFGLSPDAAPHLTVNLSLTVAALIIGIGWAWRGGKRVALTDMPQMVA
ncbi:MAG TPA: NAD(P)(+) transhydrogenase (Re/Si-specific) subunit beta, partial [Gemmatimonadaceae bacterium]